MTFSGKLTVGILLLLCLTLSLGGAWTIDQNLQAALLSSQTQNTAFHQRERNSLEQALRADGVHTTVTAAKAVQAYARELQSSVGAQSFSFAVMDEEGTTLYSILPRAVRYEVLRSAIAAGPRSVTFCDPDVYKRQERVSRNIKEGTNSTLTSMMAMVVSTLMDSTSWAMP